MKDKIFEILKDSSQSIYWNIENGYGSDLYNDIADEIIKNITPIQTDSERWVEHVKNNPPKKPNMTYELSLPTFPTWRTIDKISNLTKRSTEHLCINDKEEVMIGYLCYDEEKNWLVDGNNTYMDDVIAYIPVSEIINSFKNK